MTDPTLIADLEAATGPSRELDARIHRAVTPELADTLTGGETGSPGTGWLVGGDHAQPTEAPPYMASLDAAVSLVPEGMDWRTGFDNEGPGRRGSAFVRPPGQTTGWAFGATPALALCIAALKARANE
jgi:hypothetical protein